MHKLRSSRVQFLGRNLMTVNKGKDIKHLFPGCLSPGFGGLLHTIKTPPLPLWIFRLQSGLAFPFLPSPLT